MLIAARKYAWWMLAAAVIVWVSYVAWKSDSFQVCIADKENEQPGQKAKESSPEFLRVFVVGVRAETDCLFVFLDDSRNAITAVSTAFIALFTLTLWLSTLGMLRATNEIIAATKKDIVSTHRPKLRVRNVIVWHPSNSPHDQAPLFTDGQPLEGQFYVANIGGTSATITGAFVTVYPTSSGLPMKLPYEGRNSNLHIPRPQLAPGESSPFPFYGDETISQGANTIGTRIVQGMQLFIMGWIEYRDDIGIIRRTAFCREFARGPPWHEGRFRSVKNRDYEHEE